MSMTVPVGTSLTTHTFIDHIRVDVGGEIDLSNTLIVRGALEGALQEGPAHVVVNLSDVAFMDAAGLSSLVATARRARDCGVRFSLGQPSSKVLTILRLTRLSHTFALN